MSNKTPKPEFDLQTKVKDKLSAKSDSKEVAVEVATAAVAQTKGKLSEIMNFDIYEIMSYAILNGVKRRDTLFHVEEYLNQCDFELDPEGETHAKSVSTNHLVYMYNRARKNLFDRSMDSIASEKQSYIDSMYRLAQRAEIDRDFNAAGKCYSEIAKLGGVFDQADDNSIILNFKLVEPKNNQE